MRRRAATTMRVDVVAADFRPRGLDLTTSAANATRKATEASVEAARHPSRFSLKSQFWRNV